MTRLTNSSLLAVAVSLSLSGCSELASSTHVPHEGSAHGHKLTSTSEIIVTSEAGEKMAKRANIAFMEGTPTGVIIDVDLSDRRQTLKGVGTSFTESSAFVLAHLSDRQRRQVMQNIFGEQGANFSITRTPIGSTDFSVEGKYSYAPVANDAALTAFSIAPDQEGFSRSVYPEIVNETYDVLPMIKEALAIKAAQDDSDLRIIASAWTAPPWMKDIETWYIKPVESNKWQGTGGDLKPEYVSTYADYLVRYLDAYRDEGIAIWGLTPVNEPHGNSGQWESMHFSPRTQNEFIKNHLGPRLQESGHSAVNLLTYDQNRDGLEEWIDVVFNDEETRPYLYGAAVHWYSSTNEVYEDVFERVHESFPQFSIIHTEGTIDDLGKPAPNGIIDPVLFQESNWFQNDDFWWNANATDWAYTATWAPENIKHPVYTPVHRYARDIIVGFNHWLEGWVDWNIVLDSNGGPNHVGNFCGAPIMIDTATSDIYYTPVYHVLAQLSRTIRPGDVAVKAHTHLDSLEADALHASASVSDDGLLSVQILNTTKAPLNVALRVGGQFARLNIDANSLQTVRVKGIE
ncbi:MAG: glycoside hydrolase family 30 beta sandwich domain-containing protein [Gammaproteobacteria bacterium]